MYFDQIKAELDEAATVLNAFLSDEKNIQAVQQAALLIADRFKQGGKVLSCGNGGSHCDAMHLPKNSPGVTAQIAQGILPLPFRMSAT